MLLTIRTTQRPATDLGHLLHKHPSRAHAFELSFGRAHVFFPEATDEACTAALLLEVDPVALVRDRSRDGAAGVDSYVNDRPYAASSFLSVALSRVFGTALSGRSRERQALADRALPLEVCLAAVPSRGGERLLRALFEPLGYRVDVTRAPLDSSFPEWGASAYFQLRLSAEKRLADVLGHLYVLVPVLDDDKHYWVGEAEVEKLVRHGERWLAAHPERELIAHRYLAHQRRLTRDALARLTEPEDDAGDVEAAAEVRAAQETELERPLTLNERRIEAVAAALAQRGATSVVDLGCGEGKLLQALRTDPKITRLVGMDVSLRALEIARDRLHLDRLPERRKDRIALLHGSLLYRDRRLAGFDAAAAVEVIEHLDPPRLSAFERVVFEHARPATVVVTTPNAEYNVRFSSLPAGSLRHADHRFEWTRAEFESWARAVAERRGYAVTFAAVGELDPSLGAPTQLAVFAR